MSPCRQGEKKFTLAFLGDRMELKKKSVLIHDFSEYRDVGKGFHWLDGEEATST